MLSAISSYSLNQYALVAQLTLRGCVCAGRAGVALQATVKSKRLRLRNIACSRRSDRGTARRYVSKKSTRGGVGGESDGKGTNKPVSGSALLYGILRSLFA